MAKATLVGDKELKQKLRKLGTRARASLLDATKAGGNTILDKANQLAPGPHIVMSDGKVTGGRAEVEIGPDKSHWYYQFSETGASAHEIKAGKSARRAVRENYVFATKRRLNKATASAAMAFMGRNGLVITQKVNHPGMAAEPFLRPAIDGEGDEIVAEVGRVFRQEIDKLVD